MQQEESPDISNLELANDYRLSEQSVIRLCHKRWGQLFDGVLLF